MASNARAAAADLAKVTALAGGFVPFILNQRRSNNADVQELFDRIYRCRLCVLRVALFTREHARLTEAMPGKPLRVRQRLNRQRKRVGHECLIHLEGFYWNASRAADAAVTLGLLKAKERFALVDAFRVRNQLIEHQEEHGGLQRPSMTMSGDPVFKPMGSAKLEAHGMYAHARQLAEVIDQRIKTTSGTPQPEAEHGQ